MGSMAMLSNALSERKRPQCDGERITSASAMAPNLMGNGLGLPSSRGNGQEESSSSEQLKKAPGTSSGRCLELDADSIPMACTTCTPP